MPGVSKFKSRIAFAIAATAFALVGVIFLISPQHASDHPQACAVTEDALQSIVPTETPSPAADITFYKSDGSAVTLMDFKGRGVVLNFWATWCAPCVREMPELDRLNAELKADGIDVLAVSTDRGGHADISRFYERTGIEHLDALHDPKGVASRAAGVRGLPTTLIIDKDGREVARIQGIHHYDTPATKTYLRQCIGPH